MPVIICILAICYATFKMRKELQIFRRRKGLSVIVNTYYLTVIFRVLPCIVSAHKTKYVCTCLIIECNFFKIST